MNPALRKRFLFALFAAVLAAGLLFSQALSEYVLAPLFASVWRAWQWLYRLPLFVWWGLLLGVFGWLGLRAFFSGSPGQPRRARPVEASRSAAWVRHWITPIRQSAGGPFLRDARMSYRRLAVQALAQREHFSLRQYSRLLVEGQRSLPPEVSSLLDLLEELDEERALRRSLRRGGILPGWLSRLKDRFEGHPPEFADAPAPRKPQPGQAEELRRRLETYIAYLEREVEIAHEHEHR